MGTLLYHPFSAPHIPQPQVRVKEGIINRIKKRHLTNRAYTFILGYEFFIPILGTMAKTVKFAVSMSENVFKELESLRRRTGWTRSQFIRDAINAWKAEDLRVSGIKEETGEYRKEISSDFIDPDERRRRALAAAGRFRSGISDISINHDKYLEDSYSAEKPLEEEESKR
jgi:predicted DNA-binding protein